MAAVLLALVCTAAAQERSPPAGSFADFEARARAAAAAASGRLRFCAGLKTGNYTFAAERIAERARSGGALDLQVVHTPGATDNLRRLRDGECDIAFSQSDVFDLRADEDPDSVRGIVPFARVYSEYVHVLCPTASGWTSTAQFGPRTRLIVGAEGSGSSETWRVFRAAVPRLDQVQRIPERIDLVAFSRVKNSRDTCLLWVSGLNSADMQRANAMSANTPDRRRAIRLVSVDEPELRNLPGGDDRPMYRFEPIRAGFGVYGNLIDAVRDPLAGGSRPGTVTVPVVDAVIYASEDVLGALGDRGPELVRAVEDASPGIWARVSQPVGDRGEAPARERQDPSTTDAASRTQVFPGTESPAPRRQRVRLRTDANVRRAPSAGAPVVRVGHQGEVLQQFGASAGWVQVGTDAAEGWIGERLLVRMSSEAK